MVDLLGLVMLLVGWAVSGPPEMWHHHVGFGVRAMYGASGGGVALTLSWDPTPVRFRPPPKWMELNPPQYCGASDGWNVWVYPNGACQDTLRHELAHVAQRRAVGPIGLAVAAYLGAPLEPPAGSWHEGMWHPAGDGFALIRIEIPLMSQ